MNNLEINDYIKVTKFAAVESPHYPTPDRIDYICGQDNGAVSIFNGYEVLGNLIQIPRVGGTIWLERKVRNGVVCEGWFRSSIIQKIEGNKYYSMNSIYEIKKISI